MADLNGDGILDMVARWYEGTHDDEWHVFLGDGNGNFAIADSIVASEGDWVGDFALIDTNADGHLDLVGYQDGPVGVWHNDGTGQFAFKYYIGGVDSPWAVGDLDGDGYDDLGGCGNDIDVFYGSASP